MYDPPTYDPAQQGWAIVLLSIAGAIGVLAYTRWLSRPRTSIQCPKCKAKVKLETRPSGVEDNPAVECGYCGYVVSGSAG